MNAKPRFNSQIQRHRDTLRLARRWKTESRFNLLTRATTRNQIFCLVTKQLKILSSATFLCAKLHLYLQLTNLDRFQYNNIFVYVIKAYTEAMTSAINFYYTLWFFLAALVNSLTTFDLSFLSGKQISSPPI